MLLRAAQDERFLGGSAGANHADTLRRLFVRARAERPAAVVLLAASGGRAPARSQRVRMGAVPAPSPPSSICVRLACRVLVVGVADVFGGASVLACAAQRTALLPGVRLGLSGPAVVETARGRSELDAGDAQAIAAVFGAEARAAAGHVELLADTSGALRRWIASSLAEPTPFATWVRTMQDRLAARLIGSQDEESAPDPGRSVELATTPISPLPRMLASLYADAEPVDRVCWLWRMRERQVWLSRPFGLGTFGPREAHGLDAALLAHLAAGTPAGARTLFLVGDSHGHEVSRHAETLCVAQYLAQHAAVLALLRAQGVRLRGLLTGIGHSAAFFANALQAPEVYALADARRGDGTGGRRPGHPAAGVGAGGSDRAHSSVMGTPAERARSATTAGALRSSVCASVRPSPVNAQSAPASAASRPIRSATTSAPERNDPPASCSAKPSPPAAPAPGRSAALLPVARSASAANRARVASIGGSRRHERLSAARISPSRRVPRTAGC